MIAFQDHHCDDYDRHYDRRWQGNHRICEFDHIDELMSSSGAHFHVWIRPDTKPGRLSEAIKTIRRKRDVVSWSWSYIPGETPE